MIYVIATIEVAAGKQQEFLGHFHRLTPHVRAEQGCLDYTPTTDVETSIGAQISTRPDVITVVEKWEDIEALEAHLVAPHMLQYRQVVKDLVIAVSLQVLQPA